MRLHCPECREQLIKNLEFILMEDNSPAHNAFYTTRERGKVTIAKINLEILGLPGIMECCRALNGANSYHVVLCTSRAGSSPSSPGVPRARVRSSPGLDSARVRSSLLAARQSWRLEGLGGRRCYVDTVVVPRAQLHTEQEKIFTGVVDTWRVGINQQSLYSIGEYLIFAWLFQRKKVTCKGILTALDSSPGVPRAGS